MRGRAMDMRLGAGLSGFPPAARLSHWLKMADFTGIPVQGVHTAANYQEVTKEKGTDFSCAT